MKYEKHVRKNVLERVSCCIMSMLSWGVYVDHSFVTEQEVAVSVAWRDRRRVRKLRTLPRTGLPLVLTHGAQDVGSRLTVGSLILSPAPCFPVSVFILPLASAFFST